MQLSPCQMPYVTNSCFTELTKIDAKLLAKNMKLPINPTNRIEYFLSKMLENRQAKLSALEYDPVIMPRLLPSRPELFSRSMNMNENVPWLPQAQVYVQEIFK